MATTVTIQQALYRASPTPPPTEHRHHDISSASAQPLVSGQFVSLPVAIPQKQLGSLLGPCSVGQTPPVTPPDSPQAEPPPCMSSRLYPPESYPLLSESPPVRAIDAAGLAAALNHLATQPLPGPDEIFPWAHGVHPENHLQLDFFSSRKKSVRRAPTGVRFITVVKAGGGLDTCKLKGAVAPGDIIHADERPGFYDVDPRNGFCVRNFHIQVGKFATLSDIVVYRGTDTSAEEAEEVAKRISAAQSFYRSTVEWEHPAYSTFVVKGSQITLKLSLLH